MFKETAQTALGKKRELRLATFLIALLTATVFFVPFIITGKGYFIFYGDFNVQQIPFYQYCHEAIRSGNFGWSWQTDLGSDLLGSYSFYLLGSPFFWLTLPFPNSFVPHLMGPLLILKFACAALTSYLFIRRFTARAETAMIGGLLYAFSGFSVYNIFFNHFHEAMIFFPLLLWAMEVFMAEKRRGFLIIAVFICVLSNYYFFFGMVVFVIIYWFVRMCSNSFKFEIYEFLLMLLECVLGLLLAAALLLPSIHMVLQNDRLSSVMTGWSAVLYGKEQIFLNVIECFFFPPDLPARPVFFPGAEVKWSSLGGWMPLFGMTGVVTYLMSQKKGSWLRRIIVISAFMALVPGLNSAFSMFNTAYYARWFYMPILMMSLATALSLEDTEVNWKGSWRWCLCITTALTLVIGFLPKGMENGRITGYGLYTNASTNPFKFIYQCIRRLMNSNYKVDGNYYDLRFWITCAIALVSLLVVRAFIPAIIEKKATLFKPVIAIICIISVAYSAFFIASGQSHSYKIDDVMIKSLIKGEVTLDIAEDEFARIDVYDGVDNTGLYLGYPSINFFHSVVSSEIMDFYEYLGIKRSVASRPETDYGALRSLLSVKYLLDPEIDGDKDFENEKGDTLMSGYTYLGDQNGYKVYKNDLYIPMGFTYDYFITEEQLSTFGNSQKTNVMLKAMLVKDSDLAIANRYLKNLGNDYYLKSYESGKLSVNFTDLAVEMDCKARASSAATSFKYNSNGFTAQMNLSRDNLVFFSVPAADGWTAFVNGNKADIITVNKGFMAVAAPAGDCTIEFKYETPGLATGIIVTASTAVVIIIYLAIFAIKRKNSPVGAALYPEGERIANHIMLYEAARITADQDAAYNDLLFEDIDRDQIEAYHGFQGGFEIDDSVLSELSEQKTDKDTKE